MKDYSKPTEAANNTKYEVKVLSAKIIDDGVINFSMTVNGVNIYGLKHIKYTNAKGEKGDMISFPSWKTNRQDENGKDVYMPYVTFRIDKDLKKVIEDQIETILDKEAK